MRVCMSIDVISLLLITSLLYPEANSSRVSTTYSSQQRHKRRWDKTRAAAVTARSQKAFFNLPTKLRWREDDGLANQERARAELVVLDLHTSLSLGLGLGLHLHLHFSLSPFLFICTLYSSTYKGKGLIEVFSSLSFAPTNPRVLFTLNIEFNLTHKKVTWWIERGAALEPLGKYRLQRNWNPVSEEDNIKEEEWAVLFSLWHSIRIARYTH